MSRHTRAPWWRPAHWLGDTACAPSSRGIEVTGRPVDDAPSEVGDDGAEPGQRGDGGGVPAIVHVMRTYGPHGGEQQLRRMFAIDTPNWDEHFLFVYRDLGCERLFGGLPRLKRACLCPVSVRPRQSPWAELLLLLPWLPLLQFRFLAFLRRTGCRVCIAHGFQAALVVWPALFLVPGLRAAYVHRITKSSGVSRSAFRLVYRPFQVVAGVSVAVTDSLRGLVRHERLQVLASGIDWTTIAEAADRCRAEQSERLVLISVGRLLAHKRHDLILRAFAALRRDYRSAELWLVGDGEARARLEREAQTLELGGGVHWLGQRDDVPCWLGKSDIYVHASEVEGLSNSMLEAMAAGLPSVVMDAPGVTECHLAGETGLVVERTVEALCAGMKLLAGNPGLRMRMGRAAREHVRQRYNIESNRKQYLSLYQHLLAAEPCAES